MQIILSDHNCEGQASALFEQLKRDGGWLQLVPMRLEIFSNIGLPNSAPDDEVWERCQEDGYILLTGNRSTSDGQVSLELQIRELVTPASLPVLTIGNLKRVIPDVSYRRRCAIRMAEIVDDLENYRGTMRLFIS